MVKVGVRDKDSEVHTLLYLLILFQVKDPEMEDKEEKEKVSF